MDKDSITVYGLTIISAIILSLLLLSANSFGDSLDKDANNGVTAIAKYMGFDVPSKESKEISGTFDTMRTWSTDWDINKNDWKETAPDFHSKEYRDRIKSIVFIDNIDSGGAVATWDISAKGNDKTKAWITSDGSYFTLYIGHVDGVYANQNCSYMFANFKELRSVTFDSNFRTIDTKDMTSMFEGCSKLTTIDLRNITTKKCKTMLAMFKGCSSLTSIDLSNNNLSEVRNTYGMFLGCSSLNSFTISNSNMNNWIESSYMFYGCEKLKTVDLSTTKTEYLETLEYMFANCPILNRVYVSNLFGVEGASMYGMFDGTLTQKVTVK